MKKIKFNGFASEEEYERVKAVAAHAIKNDAEVVDVIFEDGMISVVTEHGRFHIAIDEGVYFIDLPYNYLDGDGLMVYEDLNDVGLELYDALSEEEE